MDLKFPQFEEGYSVTTFEFTGPFAHQKAIHTSFGAEWGPLIILELFNNAE